MFGLDEPQSHNRSFPDTLRSQNAMYKSSLESESGLAVTMIVQSVNRALCYAQ